MFNDNPLLSAAGIVVGIGAGITLMGAGGIIVPVAGAVLFGGAVFTAASMGLEHLKPGVTDFSAAPTPSSTQNAKAPNAPAHQITRAPEAPTQAAAAEVTALSATLPRNMAQAETSVQNGRG